MIPMLDNKGIKGQKEELMPSSEGYDARTAATSARALQTAVDAAAAEGELSRPLPPFLKWPGGKRWFVCNWSHILPAKFGTYIEPFLGAGSVYFHLRPSKALLGDLNAELVNTYRVVRDSWRSLERSLRHHQQRHLENADSHYYTVRGRVPSGAYRQASRLIYLNRACFNGIYRVNAQGAFNVPRGTKTKIVVETDDFKTIAALLGGAELIAGDFEPLVDRAKAGDLVFCDPPYTVRHNYNGFRKYNEVLFSWNDQERLAAALHRAADRGVKVICTNANHHSVRDLYRSSQFELLAVSRYSRISAENSSRRYFEELIVRANL